MPVMGPSYDEKLPRIITEEILKLLNDKYLIGNNGLDNPNATLPWGNGKRTVEFDDELKLRLLGVIHEIVKSDCYNGF